MSQRPHSDFPGGSKSRVSRAGDAVRDGRATKEDLDAIEEWRAAHRGVLNTFQAILRVRAKGKHIIVAQRHKRKRTIFDKLRRFPKMQLARMDDIAGCRMIFRSIAELEAFRAAVHAARFRHKRRNSDDKYDYIKNPKSTGYRGIHDVYSYDVNSKAGRRLKGLFIELQYRTQVQHAWATAVEVIGHITQSQPKFQRGDKRYEKAMALASEILARSFENSAGPHPELDDTSLVRSFIEFDNELGLVALLRGLNTADEEISAKRNIILVFSGDQPLEIRSFRHAPEALRELFAIEKEHPEYDVVLVKADTTDEARVAFRNYFSDATEFLQMLDEGCEKLTGPLRTLRRTRGNH